MDGDSMWALLRSLDDPQNLEHPAGYDHVATRRRFDQLVSQLEKDFSCRCNTDRDIEDASLHARLNVPSEVTDTGDDIVVCVSNFGDLAAIAVTNPGVWSHSEFETILAPRDADRLYGALDALGYTVVPEDALWADYDGPSAIAVDLRIASTWWTRFFDYF
jgi:hypothetical protein